MKAWMCFAGHRWRRLRVEFAAVVYYANNTHGSGAVPVTGVWIMDKQPELSVADFFAFGNAAAAQTATLAREAAAAQRDERSEDESEQDR
jgi:hypothetical protein